jgi:hypothetical protein
MIDYLALHSVCEVLVTSTILLKLALLSDFLATCSIKQILQRMRLLDFTLWFSKNTKIQVRLDFFRWLLQFYFEKNNDSKIICIVFNIPSTVGMCKFIATTREVLGLWLRHQLADPKALSSIPRWAGNFHKQETYSYLLSLSSKSLI